MKKPSNRTKRIAVGLLLCVALGFQCQDARPPDAFAGVEQPISIAVLPSAAAFSGTADEDEAFARRDPLGFLKACLAHYDETFRDYRCTFVKQERIGDHMTAEQWTDVRFRQEPYSVDMVWTRNADMASRALYVKHKWAEDGKEKAWVRPSGLLKLLKVKQPIHGKLAEKSSRRTIDQFGFRNSLELIIHYAEKAKRNGELELEYVGTGVIEGRPTYVLDRRLPYTGEELPYPDRWLRVHIDQEWLVPTVCISYADDEGEELLGKYILKDVQMNPGYTDADFDPDAIGF